MNKALKEIKQILKTAHATSCTPKNCGCGMDALEWQLAKLITAHDERLVERIERMMMRTTMPLGQSFEYGRGNNNALDKAIQLIREGEK